MLPFRLKRSMVHSDSDKHYEVAESHEITESHAITDADLTTADTTPETIRTKHDANCLSHLKPVCRSTIWLTRGLLAQQLPGVA